MKQIEIFSAEDSDDSDVERLQNDVNDFLKSVTKFKPKVEWMQSSEERWTRITAIITYNM